MNILFLMVCGLVFMVAELFVRFDPWGMPLGLQFEIILVVYAAFSYPLMSGLAAVCLVSFIAETFSQLSHGSLMVTNAMLFLVIQLLLDRLYTEAYLTKALWVAPFSFLGQILYGLVWFPGLHLFAEFSFWMGALIQSVGNALLCFVLFILLDLWRDKWMTLFSRKRAHITGADFYSIKNPHRKYYG